MEYKGYRAKIEYDSQEEIFHGRILGIRDVIGFHGTSMRELKKAFRESIDDYLDHCENTGKEPDREFSGKFFVRLDPAVHRSLVLEAEERGVSLNQLICERLDE